MFQMSQSKSRLSFIERACRIVSVFHSSLYPPISHSTPLCLMFLSLGCFHVFLFFLQETQIAQSVEKWTYNWKVTGLNSEIETSIAISKMCYLHKLKCSVIVTIWETVAPPNFLCLSVCLAVCPAFTAYISLSMGQILMKLGGSVETLIRFILSKFHKNRFSNDAIMM